MRAIPGMVVINPSDAVEARAAVEAAINYVGPVYMRFGRFAVPTLFDKDTYNFEIGKGVILADGTDVTIAATGVHSFEFKDSVENIAIERLNINEYNWWNEASHGIARAGIATVFPHAIGMAATFDKNLVNTVADAISTEARAKYNKSIEFGDRDIYKGLTYWAPNINIFRDPRWGRGQETFGEDPYLTAQLAVEFINGIQGDGEYYKATACAKHFAVHSGPEKTRHGFDAIASKKDMYETYLPAFEYAVKKAGVAGVMGAYNRTNGEPCCASKTLMQEILRKDWQFKGYYVSDCGAIRDIWEFHKFADSMKTAAAVSLKTGCNLNCGESYKYLIDAYEEDLITDDLAFTVPTMLKWKTQVDNNSLYNTPNCFSIYICGKVFKWIKNTGGLEAMKQRNIEKAKAITVNTINIYDLLRFETLVLDVNAVKTLEEVYA